MLHDGLMVVLLGFGMVFVVLIILIFIVNLISAATRFIIKEQPKEEPAAPVMQAGSADLTPEALAAVTCALAESLGKDVGQLIIRDVKRV